MPSASQYSRNSSSDATVPKREGLQFNHRGANGSASTLSTPVMGKSQLIRSRWSSTIGRVSSASRGSSTMAAGNPSRTRR
jgi:hypothetical protein